MLLYDVSEISTFKISGQSVSGFSLTYSEKKYVVDTTTQSATHSE